MLFHACGARVMNRRRTGSVRPPAAGAGAGAERAGTWRCAVANAAGGWRRLLDGMLFYVYAAARKHLPSCPLSARMLDGTAAAAGVYLAFSASTCSGYSLRTGFLCSPGGTPLFYLRLLRAARSVSAVRRFTL